MGNFGMSYGQKCDEDHIEAGFKHLGIPTVRNEIAEDTDLVLAFKSNKFGASHVKEWKEKTKAPVWIWTFDNMDRFKWFYEIAKECDLWLGEELGRKARFEQEGLPFYYFPYHAVPSEVFKKKGLPKEYDVVFTGTPYSCQYDPDKNKLLLAIQDRFDLHVFGNNESGWRSIGIKNAHPPAFDEKLSDIYAKARIVIAISNVQCEGYWSIRTTQALMCGAFTLARFTPQMEKELKDNVSYFQTIDECLGRIDYYLKNDTRRTRIALRGYEYAQRYLTTQQRLKELIILYENRDSIKTP